MMRLTAWILALVLVQGLASAPRQAAAADILIGTGSANGVYYHLGRSICRLVEAAGSGLACEPVTTDGSLFNLGNLRVGAFELGIVQSDWHYHAYNKSGPFEFVDDSYAQLRSLFSAHSEAFTVAARQDAGIKSFDDLKGKRVNIGNPGSGQRATMNVVMAAKGWTTKDFLVAQELSAAEQVLALCHDRVQALIYMAGHPNPAIEKAVGLCGGTLVDVSGPEIAKLIEANPYYTLTTIPKDTYAASPAEVTTFGVKATVVATADLAEETAYQVVKAVFEGLDQLRSYHPSYGDLDAEDMMTEGLSAPLHEGAARYYREKGMM